MNATQWSGRNIIAFSHTDHFEIPRRLVLKTGEELPPVQNERISAHSGKPNERANGKLRKYAPNENSSDCKFQRGSRRSVSSIIFLRYGIFADTKICLDFPYPSERSRLIPHKTLFPYSSQRDQLTTAPEYFQFHLIIDRDHSGNACSDLGCSK